MLFTYCLVTLLTVKVVFVSPYWFTLVAHCRQTAVMNAEVVSCFKHVISEKYMTTAVASHPSTRVQCLETPTACSEI